MNKPELINKNLSLDLNQKLGFCEYVFFYNSQLYPCKYESMLGSNPKMSYPTKPLPDSRADAVKIRTARLLNGNQVAETVRAWQGLNGDEDTLIVVDN